VTQEFHISVTPVGKNEYLVRTERVAPGAPLAEEQVIWEVEDWLTQAQQLMNDPLLELLQSAGSAPAGETASQRLSGYDLSPDLEGMTPPALSLVKLGQQLYNALFQGTLRDSWVTAQGIAQHRGEVLRLRLGLKGTQLPRLPWEVLHGSEGAGERRRQNQPSRPLATGTEVLFSRYQPGIGIAATTAPLPLDQPLRILMALAAPTDQEQLSLKREATHLQRELRSPGSLPEGMVDPLPEIQLTILEQPGREQLTQALEQGQYQVFHFAGHSDLSAAGGSLYLVNRRTGLTETLSGDDLAGLLVNNDIRMAVFNSCRGAYTATAVPEADDRNLAEALVSRGIPAVLAMAEQIPDDVALTLTRLFYRNLKQGYPVDLSLNRARQGLISAYGSDQLYWALPILYLHPEFDGYLTPGDRTLDNPADSLVRLPRAYDVAVPAAVAKADVTKNAATATLIDRYSQSTQDWAVLEETTLSADDFSLVDELEYTDDLALSVDDTDEDPESVDLSDDEERSLVADLISQLTQHKPTDETIIPAAAEETLLPEAAATGLETYDRLPENPRYQSATQAAPTHASTAAEQKPEAAAPNRDRAKPAPHSALTTQKLRQIWKGLRRPAVWVPLGTAGLLAIVFVTGWEALRYLISPSPEIPELPAMPFSSAASPDAANLAALDTAQVTAIASTRFNQGDLAEAQEAVAVLLDRNALPQAASALEVVPRDQIDDPDISFLRGRLAWQSLQVGNTDYGKDDVRRFWETAAKGQPDVPQYHLALGFAYHAEENSRAAIEAWQQTLMLLNSQLSGAAPSADANKTPSTELLTNQDALTAYAGMALAFKQIADELEPEPAKEYLSHAVKFHRLVVERAPTAFQPSALSRDWLWTERAIENWQALSKLEP